ncbi:MULTISPECIES: alpha/beta hydrolase [Rhodomicrobium]|uniref:alpha/beta fold hydrolase n=1 Tax=Rhodomicrobium TaxID=1068 RepID=UPI000B4AF826|nr:MULTISPECIES: alpha/beta hydrolase [Rhodomicrobium]
MDEAGGQGWEDIRFTSHDGLTLYARRYGEPSRARPVVCLAGLTRNSADFHDLASFLANHPSRPREVYCPDYRGRGKSDWDPDWRNYSPFIELLDVLDLMAIRGLHRAAVIGTSRGGIISMLMALMRPTALSSLVLNDIGPEIETAGLARIMGYAGKIPLPANWQEARDLVRSMNKRFFTNLSEEEWADLAGQFFAEENGRPAPGYDPKLGSALSEIDISQKIPTMWQQFEGLKNLPVLVLRGENSDLLSAKTVAEMAERHPRLASVTVHAQGHAPLLKDRFTIGIIADFLRETDPDTAPARNGEAGRTQLPRLTALEDTQV